LSDLKAVAVSLGLKLEDVLLHQPLIAASNYFPACPPESRSALCIAIPGPKARSAFPSAPAPGRLPEHARGPAWAKGDTGPGAAWPAGGRCRSSEKGRLLLHFHEQIELPFSYPDATE